jgi:long-chain acyl-CoA synthetase
MLSITRLFDFPYYQLEKNNIQDCLVTKYQGEWIKTSTQEYIDKANAISRALLRLGVEKMIKSLSFLPTIEPNGTSWT